MKITNKLIADLKPCKDRHEFYLSHYDGKDLEFDDFIDSEFLTYSDKIWVAKRILNKNQLVHWVILCAQSVLHVFENKYPKDKRPRECLEYLISIKDFSNLTDEQIKEIRKVRRAAADAAAAYAAADADAAYAAAAAADADADAADAAVYAAYAAADAADADAAADARKEQEQLNLSFLKIAWEKEVEL